MKKDRGSITILTLSTILFMLSFLISTYMIISNRRQAQTEIKRETQEIYESDTGNIDAIYNSYFAGSGEIIPISTPDQLLSVGTDKYIVSGDKIYKCTVNSDYELINNISFDVNDYIDKYPEKFQNSTNWIDIEQQKQKNQLTGNFSYNKNEILETNANGKKITHSNSVSYIEYIESTGTQYIDTGVYPTSTTMVRLKFNMTIATGMVIVGYYISESDVFRFFNYGNQAYLDYGSGSSGNRIYGGTISAGVTYNIEFGNRYVKDLNTGGNIISSTQVNFPTKSYTMGIFGVNGMELSLGKIYYCQIFDNGVLVRSFLPALDNSRCSLLI